MNKKKERILNDAKNGDRDTTNTSNETTSDITNASNETTAPSTSSYATGSIDSYIYGVGILAILAIGVCVFFAYNTSQTENKKVNKKQDQPPK